MNAVRSTLEDLTGENGTQATHVRELFTKRYGEQVSKALQRGAITVPPEKDATFAKALPKTQKFIRDMLGNGDEHVPACSEQIPADAQNEALTFKMPGLEQVRYAFAQTDMPAKPSTVIR